MSKKHLYIIDANAFCYRAFYALRNLSTSFGQPTNAIYGFVNILNKILREKNPDYLAVCFDVSRNTFRQKRYAEYKIQRPPMPDGLSSQIPLIKEIVSAYGISLFEKEGFEADDIIATLDRLAKEKGIAVTVVSPDKDILQLVDDNTRVFNPGKDAPVVYDKERVLERFGVPAQMIPEVIALMGDASDNIPSVPGIGEKTAVGLIQEFGSLDKILKHAKDIKQEKIRQAVIDNIEMINLNRELAVLDDKVELDFSLDKLKIGNPNNAELFRLFKYLEFKSFIKDIRQPDDVEAKRDIRLSQAKDLKVTGTDELYIYGTGNDDLVFGSKGEGFLITKIDDNIRRILLDAGIKKVGHDLKKLKASLAAEGVVLEGLYFDTMIAAYLLNPSKTAYKLTDVAWDYLGVNAAEKGLVPEKAIGLIMELKPKLDKELRDKALFKLFQELEMPLVSVLSQMEQDGIKIDTHILRELSRDIEKRLIKLIEEIYELSGTQFNINSPKQLREILFEKLKLPIQRKSKTGPSTDEEVLRKLALRHALPALLLEYRQLMKLKNTYIDTLPLLIDKKTGRIHTSFNQTGTETGRLSSSNPNLQNIPTKTDIGKNIRRAIIVSKDTDSLLSCDYSQVELRVLAHLSGDKNLISAFKEDKDVHKITASLIYGIEEKDVTQEMREVAKRVNFGIVYGLTSYGLSRDLGISVDAAQQFIDAYFLRYPRVKDYVQSQITLAEKEGFVTTLLGRRRYIPEINNKNQGLRQFAQRQAINTPIQGSASDLIKLAMIQIAQVLKQKKMQSRMILQIHDELLFDVPRQELKEAVSLVKEKMEGVLKLDVPIRVDIKKGKNWLEMEEVK